jgi:7-cyano-7-deazaguanine synthase in queuosine biosynthesis
MNPEPTAGVVRHCGRCSKCRERHDAFVQAGIPDQSNYRDTQFVRA